MGNDRLHDGGEEKAKDQRPQDLPSHAEGHGKSVRKCIDHRLL
jgi:hypothetical protein